MGHCSAGLLGVCQMPSFVVGLGRQLCNSVVAVFCLPCICPSLPSFGWTRQRLSPVILPLCFFFPPSCLYKLSHWRTKLGGFIHFVLQSGSKQDSYISACQWRGQEQRDTISRMRVFLKRGCGQCVWWGDWRGRSAGYTMHKKKMFSKH